ncbi:hypothetical protein IHE56_11570 [Streptomyces sp. ID01-12c]|uniref:hypothetical protein n=1 Tax=Streptomyces caniscabiei TaxID=2746961 RepID=UPI00177B5502|nr:hypothetical protein [Streptomyces caniscabiei]MBD9702721.1 hypothetical protein [Streptomyces caniscabiei]MDX3728510.1 hypothetical protein [Streptomyces caniscabiei]
MADPVFRTILLFDIERFGSRDDVEQAYLRRILYDVVEATLVTAGVDETARLRADRGDSVMELIDTQASVPALVKTLLTETPALLHSKNRLLASSARMRLRIVLSSGYVAVDELDGWVGSDLNHAVRLLNSDPLRDALKRSDADGVLCVSDAIYQGVVRHGPLGVRPDDFHRVTVETKEGPTVAWVPGEPVKDTASEPEWPAGEGTPRDTSPDTSSTRTRIGGDQFGVTGGTVHGDLNFGMPGRGGRR